MWNSWTDLGRPSQMILEDRRRTIDDLVDLSGVSWSSCQRISSEELKMKRAAAKVGSGGFTKTKRQRTKPWVWNNFYPKTAWPSFSTRHIHLISLRATSFYSPEWKKSSKENVLRTWKRWKKKTTKALRGIILQEFQDCFEKWKTRLDRCIASNGQYFEGDWICNT